MFVIYIKAYTISWLWRRYVPSCTASSPFSLCCYYCSIQICHSLSSRSSFWRSRLAVLSIWGSPSFQISHFCQLSSWMRHLGRLRSSVFQRGKTPCVSLWSYRKLDFLRAQRQWAWRKGWSGLEILRFPPAIGSDYWTQTWNRVPLLFEFLCLCLAQVSLVL